MSETDKLQSFLHGMLEGIVLYPDDVEIKCSVDEMGTLFTVKVNPADMGLVIGKSGATISAIRLLVRTAGSHSQCRASVKIEEPVGRETFKKDAER